MKRLALTLLAALASTAALACEDRYDCAVGSSCVDGACVGGLFPGNDDDERPLGRSDRLFYGVDRGYGDTCYSNAECEVGMVCIKGRGTAGTCMQRR